MPDLSLGPTGIPELGPSLPDSTLEHLRTIFASHGHRGKPLESVLRQIDFGAQVYFGDQVLKDQARPGVVRSELRALQSALLRLVDRLNSLGGVSRQALYMGDRADGGRSVRASVAHLDHRIRMALEMADNLPRRGGRPRSFADLHLAIWVRHVIRTHLGEEPTITRGGLFEDVLKTLLETLSPDREDPSVRDLMRAARRAQITVSEGLVEISPRVE